MVAGVREGSQLLTHSLIAYLVKKNIRDGRTLKNLEGAIEVGAGKAWEEAGEGSGLGQLG